MTTKTTIVAFGNAELTTLQKVAILTVLIDLRDTYNLKSLTEVANDLNNIKLEFCTEFLNASYQISDLFSDILKIVAHDKLEQRVRVFHTAVFRACLQDIENLERSLESISTETSVTDFKHLETAIANLRTDWSEKQLEESNMSTDICNHLIYQGYQNSYIYHWYEAKTDQITYYCDKRIKDLEKEKQKYHNLILREQIIFDQQIDFLNFYNNQLKTRIDVVNKEQERKSDKFEFKLNRMKYMRDEIFNAYENAKQTIEEHKEWVQNAKRTDAVITFQRQWRKVLQARADQRAAEEALLAKKRKREAAKAKKDALFRGGRK